jgi:hypothetical protein
MKGIILNFNSEMVVIDKNVNLVGNASHYLLTVGRGRFPDVVMKSGTVFTADEMKQNGYQLVKAADYDYHCKLMNKHEEFRELSKIIGMVKKEHLKRLEEFFK